MAVPARPVGGAPLEAAWGAIAHDTAVAVDIQTGSAACVHSNAQVSPAVAVVFPRPFAAPPMVVLGVTNYNFGAGLAAPATATGFSVATWRYSGPTSGTVPVQWVAIGPRA